MLASFLSFYKAESLHGLVFFARNSQATPASNDFEKKSCTTAVCVVRDSNAINCASFKDTWLIDPMTKLRL